MLTGVSVGTEQLPQLYVFQKDDRSLVCQLDQLRSHGLCAQSVSSWRDIEYLNSKKEDATFFCVIEELTGSDLNHIQLIHDRVSSRGLPLFIGAKLPYSREVMQVVARPGIRILPLPIDHNAVAEAIKSHLAARGASVDYDRGIYKAIEDSLQEVVGFYLQSNVMDVKMFLKHEIKIDSFISSVLNFSGPQHYGSLLVSFDRVQIIRLATAMLGLNLSTVPEDSVLLDTCSEICNQLSSLFAHKISRIGIDVQIGLPTPFHSQDTGFMHLGSNPVGNVNFKMPEEDTAAGNIDGKRKNSANCEICIDKAI